MKLIYSFEDYSRLYELARKRTRSAQDYQIFEQYQCKLLIKYFQNKNISLNKKLVLDLGCGLGGFMKEFLDYGAFPVGLDLEISNTTISMVTKADALKTPFNKNQFDLVLSGH